MNAAFAQDLCAHAVGAQVHAATLGAMAGTGRAFKLRQQLRGRLAAVEQHHHAFALDGNA